jgi:enoyl-CoA hydratase/carnithine racemase
MVNGPAVGSGMDMALHCDIRVGCERSRFLGYHNAGQITPCVSPIVGIISVWPQAMHWALTKSPGPRSSMRAE